MKLFVRSQVGQRFLIETNDEPDYMTKYLMDDGRPFGYEVKLVFKDDPIVELEENVIEEKVDTAGMEEKLDENMEDLESEENVIEEVKKSATVKSKARRGRKPSKK